MQPTSRGAARARAAAPAAAGTAVGLAGVAAVRVCGPATNTASPVHSLAREYTLYCRQQLRRSVCGGAVAHALPVATAPVLASWTGTGLGFGGRAVQGMEQHG